MCPLRIASQPPFERVDCFVDRSNLNRCLGAANGQVRKRIAVDAASTNVLGRRFALAVNYSHEFLRGNNIIGAIWTTPLAGTAILGSGVIQANLRLLRRSSLSAPQRLHRS